MLHVRNLTLIAVVGSALFFIGLGDTKLWDRDEPRNAGCAQEMMARGEYVTPVFNGELRDAKPVLLYWLIISAYQVLGVTEFAARFWSATAALGSVLCTYFIGQRLFDRRTGLLAATMLSTSLMFVVAARAATPDSILIFFSTASLSIFVAFAFPARKPIEHEEAGEESGNGEVKKHYFPRSWSMAFSMYAVMAVGVLAKGPIGFLMPTSIIGMYLLIVSQKKNSGAGESPARELPTSLPHRFGRWMLSCIRPFHPVHFLKTCWSMRLPVAILLILIIAGPWFFLVGQRTDGEFLKTFFLKEHLGRSTTSFENHSGTIFYYPLVMCFGFFPWSIFALPVLVSIFRAKDYPRTLVFLFCWVGVQVGVFTIVQTKLPSYVTPCYPALAILCAHYLKSWARGTIELPTWLPRLSFATLGVVGVITIIGLAYVATAILETGSMIAIVGIFPLVAGGASLVLWQRFSEPESRLRSIQVLQVSAIATALLFFGWVLPRVSGLQQYDQLLEPARIADHSNVKLEARENSLVAERAKRPLGSYACLEPTWVFYGGQPIYELVESSEDTFRLSAANEWRPKPRPGLQQFLIQHRGRVITPKELVPKIESVIKRPVSILSRSPYFMKDGELVLIEVPDVYLAKSKASAGRPLQ